MATFDIVANVATKIQTDGHGTLGTDLFKGPVRAERTASPAVPRTATFVSGSTGGPPPAGIGGDVNRYRSAVAIVRVRHASLATGRTLAQSIYNSLAVGTLSGYINLNMDGSGPRFLGQDENGAYEWAMNLTAMR
jgi:hypothetical protein